MSVPEKPNILMVLLDGCRADRLGCYGYKDYPTSPTLDKFAKQGFVALNNYSTSNCTMSAVVSMMTGLYPCLHQAASAHCYYDGKYPFLTEVLQQNGYYTFGIANNIIAMSPDWGFIRGYDKFYRVGKEDNWLKESKEEQRGVKEVLFNIKIKRNILKGIGKFFPELQQTLVNKVLLNRYNNRDMGGAKAVVTLAKALQERDETKPFFGYINLPDTHHPYIAPKKLLEQKFDYCITKNLAVLNFNPSLFYFNNLDLMKQEYIYLNIMYDECVRYIDQLVQRIHLLLTEAKLLENTIIIFCADHGGMLFEKNKLFASGVSSYNPEIKVPLIIWGKNIQPQTINETTSVMDIFPTVMNICNIKYSDSIHGKDLLSKYKGHSEVIIDYPAYPDYVEKFKDGANKKGVGKVSMDLFSKINRTMITTDGYKIIWTSKDQLECYDLRVDSMENNNISKNVGDELLERMKNKYINYLGEGDIFSSYPCNYVGIKQSTIKFSNNPVNKEIIYC